MDLNLSISQQFDIERFNRAIDDSENIDEIRGIAKQLLMAWQTQRAATNWIMKSSLSAPAVIIPPIPENESN
jgi:hypothetical protein